MVGVELFRGVVPFVVVAQELSFRKAAKRLHVSPAAVSKAVKALEEDLDVVLLDRGPRTVSLTREGTLFFERCRLAVEAVVAGREAAEGARRSLEGEVSISVPFLAAPLLCSALTLLRSRHPRLWFRVLATDRYARLVEESVDLAVRMGVLEGKTLVARRLRTTKMITVAAPSYLSRAGTPRAPADLDGHACLTTVGPGNKPRPWRFSSGARVVAPALLTDHAPTVVDAALGGLGVAQVVDFMVDATLREGRLVQVLVDHVAPGPDVHAVCAPGRRATPRVREAFEALADVMAER